MTSLVSLSDAELLERIARLDTQRRQTTAALVAHLAELDARRLHLRQGYASLYDYCLAALHLSEDEAYRRVTAARLVAQAPEIVSGLQDGELSLSAVVLLKPHLTSDNRVELLGLARGASKRELEKRLAARFPQAERPDSLWRGRLRPTTAERYRLEVQVGESTRLLLERALDLTGHTNPSRALEPVLERALGLLVADLERQKRATRRSASRRGRVSSAPEQQVKEGTPAPERNTLRAETPAPERKPSATTPRRAVPRPLRRVAFERAEDRCSYVSPEGRRCECRTQLELDHPEPWSLYPSHATVRVLCRAHNRLLAEDWFGRVRISGAIAARRQR